MVHLDYLSCKMHTFKNGELYMSPFFGILPSLPAGYNATFM